MTVGRVVAAAVVVFLGVRLTTLLTASGLVSYYEELYRGTIARELIAGLHAPLWSYQADHYSGGSLVVGLLAVVPFALLGPSLFALKLVPLAVAAATLAVAVHYLGLRFGWPAAAAGAALLVASPPALTQLSLIAVGYHPESTLFGVGTLSLLLAYLAGEPRRRRLLFFAGLVGGLGVWFTFISAIALLTAGVAWVALDRRRITPATLAFFAAGVALGVVPAVAYAVAHGLDPGSPSLAEVLLSVDEPLAVRLAKLPARVVKIAVYGLPLSAGFPDFGRLPGVVLSYLYWGLALAVVVPLAWREARRPVALGGARAPLLPLLLYPAFHVTVYAATPIWIRSGESFVAARHLAPLHVFGLLLVAVAVTRVRAGRLVLGGLLVLGLAGQSALVFREPAGRALTYVGSSYAHLGTVWQTRLGSSPAAFTAGRRRFDRFAEPERAALYRGAAGELTDLGTLEVQLREVPAAYRAYFVEALGRALADRRSTTDEVSTRLDRLSEAARGLACRGFELARAHEAMRLGWRELEARAIAGPPRACAGSPAALVSLGYLLAGYRHRDQGCAWLRAELASRTTAERAWVYRGLGQGAVFLELARTGVPGGVWPTGLSPDPPPCALRDPAATSLLARPDTIESLAADVPSVHRADYFWGVGWEILDSFREDPARARDWIGRLPAEARSAASAGADAADRWYRS